LDVVEGTHLQKEITDWFKTLPLWLDLGGLRVVHACWHQASIDLLSKAMGSGQRVTDEMIVLGSRKGSPVYQAIETVCKGPEVKLPDGVTSKDKDGRVRDEVRVKWWEQDLSTYRKAAQGPPEEVEKIPDLPMPAEWVGHPYVGPPVLFGHYWFTAPPRVICPRFACLDYSAARDGPLVEYRWDGEAELFSEKLAWV
jgi:hypothetical protein